MRLFRCDDAVSFSIWKWYW